MGDQRDEIRTIGEVIKPLQADSLAMRCGGQIPNSSCLGSELLVLPAFLNASDPAGVGGMSILGLSP